MHEQEESIPFYSRRCRKWAMIPQTITKCHPMPAKIFTMNADRNSNNKLETYRSTLKTMALTPYPFCFFFPEFQRINASKIHKHYFLLHSNTLHLWLDECTHVFFFLPFSSFKKTTAAAA